MAAAQMLGRSFPFWLLVGINKNSRGSWRCIYSHLIKWLSTSRTQGFQLRPHTEATGLSEDVSQKHRNVLFESLSHTSCSPRPPTCIFYSLSSPFTQLGWTFSSSKKDPHASTLAAFFLQLVIVNMRQDEKKKGAITTIIYHRGRSALNLSAVVQTSCCRTASCRKHSCKAEIRPHYAVSTSRLQCCS